MPKKIATVEMVARIEAFFGDRVIKITAPGGRSRASLRVYFADRSIIVTNRPEKGRTQHEARVLELLSPQCDVVPGYLGVDGPLLFQADVGIERLSVAIQKADPVRRVALAKAAISGIFAYQLAAQSTVLMQTLNRLGTTERWIDKVAGGPARLATRLRLTKPALDNARIGARLRDPRIRFIKWDCRAGNAAIGPDGHLRWFDFEYAALRHGAEDLAWLIADEIWPVPPEIMFPLIEEEHRRFEGTETAAYMNYLALFTTLHAVQRILLILDEVAARGWQQMSKVLGKDDVGVTPRLGMRLCEVGIWCAELDPMMRPVIPILHTMHENFAATIQLPPAAEPS